jgi:hypothetical protein
MTVFGSNRLGIDYHPRTFITSQARSTHFCIHSIAQIALCVIRNDLCSIVNLYPKGTKSKSPIPQVWHSLAAKNLVRRSNSRSSNRSIVQFARRCNMWNG